MLLDHKLRMLRAWQSIVLSLRPRMEDFGQLNKTARIANLQGEERNETYLQVVESPFTAKFDIHG